MAQGGNGFHYIVNGVDKGVKYTTDPITVSGLPIGPNAISIKLVDASGAYTTVQDAIVVTVTNSPAVVTSMPLLRNAIGGVVSPTVHRLIGIDGRVIRTSARGASFGNTALRPGVYVSDTPGAGNRAIAIVR